MQVVGHPYFIYWWLKLVDRVKSGQSEQIAAWLADFGRFLVIPLLKNGTWGKQSIVLHVVHNEVRFPGIRHHISLGETQETELLATLEGEALVLTGKFSEYRIPVADLLCAEGDSQHPMLKSRKRSRSGFEIDATDPWVGNLFAAFNSRPPLEGYGSYDFESMDDFSTEYMEHFEYSFELLKEVWPDLWKEATRYVKLIVPYKSSWSSTFTDSVFMGAVFMSQTLKPFADRMYTAEHFLHEASHLRLTIIMGSDRLFTEKAEQGLYTSPFRRDPRPLRGIFHGAFVFARIAEFCARGYRVSKEIAYLQRLEKVLIQLDGALQVLNEHATFTDRGQRLMGEMSEIVLRYREEYRFSTAPQVS